MSVTQRMGAALVLCAPSGTGKTTLGRRLTSSVNRFAFSVSYTTREPRPGEINGRDYHFVDSTTFIDLRDSGFFAEWAEVHGNFYGTPLEATRSLLRSGSDVLFDIDVQGASQLKQNLPGACFVFILPPSRHELERRLRNRGTDDEAAISRRLAGAGEELMQAHWFDAWIINENLEQAFEDLSSVYRSACLTPALRPEFVRNLLKDWPLRS